jgi:hypothetical protein
MTEADSEVRMHVDYLRLRKDHEDRDECARMCAIREAWWAAPNETAEEMDRVGLSPVASTRAPGYRPRPRVNRRRAAWCRADFKIAAAMIRARAPDDGPNTPAAAPAHTKAHARVAAINHGGAGDEREPFGASAGSKPPKWSAIARTAYRDRSACGAAERSTAWLARDGFGIAERVDG